MALNSAAITAAIADLEVTGISIRDTGEIPQTVTSRDCPVFFPMPDNWIGGSQIASEEQSTFGTPSTRYWTVLRDYQYMYLHHAAGAGRGNRDHYAAMVELLENLIEAILTLDVSGVDVVDVGHSPIGTYKDPAGNQFGGCPVTITFRERINA